MYTDNLGSPRAVTIPTGTVVWDWPYNKNPFGEAQASGNGYTLNLRYPGQYFDAETGLNYNGWRDYESGTDRYIESDPLGLMGGVSTYSYTASSPLKHVDPEGLSVLASWPVDPNSWPTIQCDGEGGINIFYGHQYTSSQMQCFGDCITQHENKHIDDYSYANPAVCAGKPEGLQVYSPSQRFVDQSEVRAYKASIDCLKAKLEVAKHDHCDKCKASIQKELAREEDQLRRYSYRLQSE